MSMLYIASIDNPDDFLYKKEDNKDLELLSKHLKIVDFEDEW